jgi:hypothetical protein
MTAIAPRAWPGRRIRDLTREVFADRAPGAAAKRSLLPLGEPTVTPQFFYTTHNCAAIRRCRA